VHLLLEDLRSGQLDVRSESRLPDGLTAYYDALVARMHLTDTQRDLIAIMALLSRAADPLDAAGLALLLPGARPEGFEQDLQGVEVALRAGAALLRRAPGPDTADGWTLYHQSFREYVGTTSSLKRTVAAAERSLVENAARWAALGDPRLGPVRNHLFRWGTEYALWWGGAAGVDAARARLTDFAYLQARTAALPAAECADLAREYADVLAARGGEGGDPELRLWEAFVREREHLLRRGDAAWPAGRGAWRMRRRAHVCGCWRGMVTAWTAPLSCPTGGSCRGPRTTPFACGTARPAPRLPCSKGTRGG
jgi:hypothetical protein